MHARCDLCFGARQATHSALHLGRGRAPLPAFCPHREPLLYVAPQVFLARCATLIFVTGIGIYKRRSYDTISIQIKIPGIC